MRPSSLPPSDDPRLVGRFITRARKGGPPEGGDSRRGEHTDPQRKDGVQGEDGDARPPSQTTILGGCWHGKAVQVGVETDFRVWKDEDYRRSLPNSEIETEIVSVIENLDWRDAEVGENLLRRAHIFVV